MSPEADGTVPGDDGHADDQAPDSRVSAPEVDARGRRCPLPVIALARAAQGLGAGSVLTLLATDPATRHDVPAWCRMRGHVLVSAPAAPSPASAPPSPASAPPSSASAPREPPSPEPPSPAVLRFVVRLGPPTPS